MASSHCPFCGLPKINLSNYFECGSFFDRGYKYHNRCSPLIEENNQIIPCPKCDHQFIVRIAKWVNLEMETNKLNWKVTNNMKNEYTLTREQLLKMLLAARDMTDDDVFDWLLDHKDMSYNDGVIALVEEGENNVSG